MKLKLRQLFSLKVILAVAFLLLVSACHKKQPPAPTPAAPPPPAPKAMLTANPNTITAGQATTLTWSTDFATEVSIDGIGKVDPSGSTKVTPSESTTYRLVAKNETSTQEATARVTVTPASAPPTSGKTTTDSDSQLFSQNMKDVFYAYDSYEISPEGESVIQADAKFLQQHPNMTFVIQGHCDERGSIEYNL